MNLPGNYIEDQTTLSILECQRLCEQSSNCSFFTFDPTVNHCWIKSSDDGRIYDPQKISGPKYCYRKGKVVASSVYSHLLEIFGRDL